MSNLEKDFEKTAEQINEKIKEAARALEEANKLADEAGLPGLIFTQFTRDDMIWENRNSDNPISNDELKNKVEEIKEKFEYIDVGPLESELGQAGWSTSSSYC